MRIDLEDDRLPATRRAVRWLLGLIGVAGLLDGLGPIAAAAGGLLGRTPADLVLTTVALSVPWWAAAALLPHRPRLATAMAYAMALVAVPRQLWQGWLMVQDLRASGLPVFPDLVPRLTVVLLVLVTLWLAHLSRARGHWREPASWVSRRALVPAAMALLWTVGPITDPVPSTGGPADGLLPLYLLHRWTEVGPWVFLSVHAVPVLALAVFAVTRHRRVAGVGMLLYGTVMFLLLLADYLRARDLWDATLLPIGGVTFLGLVSLIVIGHQWSTEGARFVDPGTPPPHLLRAEAEGGSVP